MILCSKSIEEIEEIAKEEQKDKPQNHLLKTSVWNFYSADDIDAKWKDNVADYFCKFNVLFISENF